MKVYFYKTKMRTGISHKNTQMLDVFASLLYFINENDVSSTGNQP